MITHVTRAAVPIEALRLTEDIRALEAARKLLDTVDVSSVTKDPELGRQILRVTQSQLRASQQYAEQRLREEFLAPRKRKLNA
jgi:hypothetical protein